MFEFAMLLLKFTHSCEYKQTVQTVHFKPWSIGKPQKNAFFSSPATKAFRPPPSLGLVAIGTCFHTLKNFFYAASHSNSNGALN